MTRQKKTTICPLGGVGVGGRWKFWIWYRLLDGPKRFGELQRLIPQASRQMLTIQLRELEQMGIIHRHAYMQVPPKVEYSLTELGQTIEPVLRQWYTWENYYSKQVDGEFEWLMVFDGRWRFWIWYHLLSGPRRFGDLQRVLPQASRQMLTRQLRELERRGVVRREVYMQVPPKVEYSLTELGWSLGPVMRQSYAWMRWYCEQVGLKFDWPVSDEAGVYVYQ